MQAQTITDTTVDEFNETDAAGEIARHWYEQENWLRLETVLTDQEMLASILAQCEPHEILDWWAALRRETGVSLEDRYKRAWRQWELDDSAG